MGLLSVGTPLPWEDAEQYAEYIKTHGILQFISLYRKLKDRTHDVLKWGDEIEFSLVYLDHDARAARLLLKSAQILPTLQIEERQNPGQNATAWRMEYADYMIEGTPGQPYGGCITAFNRVEASMKKRREELEQLLNPGETVISFASFPRIGCPEFTEPIQKACPELNQASRSLYYPDRAIYPDHPRFATLTRNIRSRRGRRQIINVPVFRDENTPSPFIPDTPNDDGEAALAIKPDFVYMDCMGFGMGCSCLQVTFQACNINEARHLYDQLANLGPIMMALSAASPAYQGTLVDTDCRWEVISQSVDDRSKEELGEEPLKTARRTMRKSRYDCIDMYISEPAQSYNDVPVAYEDSHYSTLINAGVDKILSQHIAHLFVRDPISVFREKIFLNDDEDVEHFENLQSTNWQSIRFKPPPPGSEIGWRVEFRTMEVQLTDFENAAYVVFIVLLTRVILSYKLNLLIPISKVEKNMKTAQKRDAVTTEKFFFRKKLTCSHICQAHVELMSIDTIVNGKENGFPGLIPMMKSYMESIDTDVDTSCTISQYLNLISKRASGELNTTAGWMRKYIRSHPKYAYDSRVSSEIMYDLAVTCDKISRGEIGCPDLFGKPKTRTSEKVPFKCVQVAKEVDQLTAKIKNSAPLINPIPIKNKLDPDEEQDQLEAKIGSLMGVATVNGNVQM